MPQATIPRGARTSGTEAAFDRVLTGLSTIARAVNQVRLHERFLDSAGVRLDRAGASLLSKLEGSEGDALRVTELAERLGVDSPTVTRKVQQLERLGLVVRADDPEDRRAHRIGLTPSGRKTLRRLTTAKREWIEHLLAGWSGDDLDRFASLLGRFTDRLGDEMEADRGN